MNTYIEPIFANSAISLRTLRETILHDENHVQHIIKIARDKNVTLL